MAVAGAICFRACHHACVCVTEDVMSMLSVPYVELSMLSCLHALAIGM